jgi:hypothetical protein
LLRDFFQFSNMMLLRALFLVHWNLLLALLAAIWGPGQLVWGDCAVAGSKMSCQDPVGNLTGVVEAGVSLLNVAASSWIPTIQLLRVWLPNLKVSFLFP